MGKTIHFSFAINRLLDPRFSHMTGRAKQQLADLSQKTRETNAVIKQLRNGFKQGVIS